MKSFSPGLSDSIASVLVDARTCPHCDSSSRLTGGLCVGCLVRAGLDPAEDDGSDELSKLLAETKLPDQSWRLGNYEILEEIGRGGMGVIYRARQRHSKRIVAVKRVLSYHADSRETVARFRREAQAAASLDHPNILPIYEVSESEDGLPFFSMKFATGGTLQQVAPALRNDPRQSVALVARMARAVQYAHSRGILHRDLKPGNILLDGHGEPLVSDFGLAKWLDTSSDLTRTLTIFGTPGYIAPEQASCDATELKPTADVYSLGAILFDLLAGRPPFLGTHALSVIRQAAENTAPKLRTLCRVADRDLETICARCLEREPTARYRCARDLAEDLERWLEGRPIIARRVWPTVRLWRWSKRNPTLAGSLAATVVLGCIGITATITNSRLSSIVQDAALAEHSVAVMPFEDLDEVSTTSVSSRAATEAFAAALGGASGIQLRPAVEGAAGADPWHVEDWRRIGKQAGARFVLSGSVRHREGNWHAAVHLIETATGATAQTWLRDGESWSEVSSTLVKAIATPVLLVRKPASGSIQSTGNNDVRVTGGTSNHLARSYYERGKELFLRHNMPDLDRAIDSFRTATRLDGDYAQAQALLATTCQLRSSIEPDGAWLDEADAAVAKALTISPTLAEAYDARAANAVHRGRIREALDDYFTAYELEPGNGRACARLADAYYRIGRADRAMLWYLKANRRETQPIYADYIGHVWMDLEQYDKAEESYKTAAIFQPDLPTSAVGLSRLELFRGQIDKARLLCKQASEKYPGNPEPLVMAAQIEFFTRNFEKAEKLYSQVMQGNRGGGVGLRYPGGVRFLSAIAFIHARMGIADGKDLLNEALALDQKEVSAAPDNPARLYSLAADYAALEQREAALTTLEKAIEAGWIDLHSIVLDPRFDSIRPTPGFRKAIAQLHQTISEMAERTNTVTLKSVTQLK